MKIGFVVPNYYPDITGGIEWYAYHITHELSKLGHDIHVFTQLSKKANKRYEKINNINIHRLKSYGYFYRLKFLFNLNKELGKHKLNALIPFDYALPFSWQTLFFGKHNNIPVLTLLYDVQSQKKPRHFAKQFFLDIFDKYFAKYILKYSDRILLRTPAPKKWLGNLGVDLNKTRITPSGITSQELLPGNKENFKNKYKIKDNIILYLGRIRKQKGIFLLLDAFREVKKNIPNAKLVYVGTDDKEYDGLKFTPQLKKEIKEKNIKDVYILGPIFGSLKNDALAACSLLALPSSYEAFGQVYIQAMAQSKPVIGTNTGGVPYVIDHKKNGFLMKPWNKEKLVFYITKTLNEKQFAKDMGENGLEKASQYEYSKLAKSLENILKEVLNK